MWHERSGLVCYQFIRERLPAPASRIYTASQRPANTGQRHSALICVYPFPVRLYPVSLHCTGVLWLSALVICSGYLVICHNDHH